MKMISVSSNDTRSLNGGWNVCRMCGQYVSGGFWTKYGHCVKHAWNSVMPIASLVGVCFGLFG